MNRVLIVDGDVDTLRRARAGLLVHGFSVLTATNREEALELLSASPVSVMVVEHALEGRTGHKLVEEVRRRWSSTACVLAVTNEDGRRVAREVGASRVVAKPYDNDRLVNVLASLRGGAGFTGTGLTGFNLTDLLQLVSMSGQAMTLRVNRGDEDGEMCVSNGRLVHARAGDMSGVDAGLEMLSWTDGEVASSPEVLPEPQWTSDLPVMELLMNAARHRDEQVAGQQRKRTQAALRGLVALDGVLASVVYARPSFDELFVATSEEAPERDADRRWIVLALDALKEADSFTSMHWDGPRHGITVVPIRTNGVLVVWTQAGGRHDPYRSVLDDLRVHLEETLGEIGESSQGAGGQVLRVVPESD